MSEEAKPWREWGEWERIRSVVRNCDPLIQFDVQEGLDALCARVWREAESRRAEISVEGTRDILDELQAERARANAAEARADREQRWRGYAEERANIAEARELRLEAALTRHAEERHDALKSEGRHTGRFITCSREPCLSARAALAYPGADA